MQSGALHHGFIRRLQPAGKIDIQQCFLDFFRMLAVMHRHVLPEGKLLYQTVCTGTVEAHPMVFPRVFPVGRIGDKLVRLGKKNVARAKLIHLSVQNVSALPGCD